MPNPSDRAAATLSKELRKLQAESAVFQEHSHRLQEKASVVQQQRASADQVCGQQYKATNANRLIEGSLLHWQYFTCGLCFLIGVFGSSRRVGTAAETMSARGMTSIQI